MSPSKRSTGDMTQFWYDDLYHRWKQGPSRSQGSRLTGRCSASSSSRWISECASCSGPSTGPLTPGRWGTISVGPVGLIGDARRRDGRHWAAVHGRFVTQCSGGRTEIAVRRSGRCGPTQRSASREPLYSWVIAPAAPSRSPSQEPPCDSSSRTRVDRAIDQLRAHPLPALSLSRSSRRARRAGRRDDRRGKQVFDNWCAACHAPGPRHPGTQALDVLYKGAKPGALEQRTDLVPAITQYLRANRRVRDAAVSQDRDRRRGSRRARRISRPGARRSVRGHRE